MHGYYAERLADRALERCYQLAPPRVQRYLAAELEFVVAQLRPTDLVLDLGCGYGRAIPAFARAAGFVVGIDTSLPSLEMASRQLRTVPNAAVACMDGTRLGLAGGSFDVVACVQNGICAFHVDQRLLLGEALRMLRPGGTALFSTYAERFWAPRLEWFERQAAAGLIGEIDRERTRPCLIVCTDGFTSGTLSPEEFPALIAGLEVKARSVEVDGSSRFFILRKPSP
ncbi:MAG TPA: class I SAM-dependent methyltransferase [Actinomycetota bacterium]|nr:class I SAM-dependent methyltransferase [Actinomycetota bacterium]